MGRHGTIGIPARDPQAVVAGRARDHAGRRGGRRGHRVHAAGVRHVGANYYPTAALGVDIELGEGLVWNPSPITTGLGLPSDYVTWFNDPMVQSVALRLEEYTWLATCGTSRGLLDGYLEFDAGGSSIQFEVERNYVPAGSLSFVPGARRLNPRWYAEKVAVNVTALFDHVFFSAFE